MAAGPYERAVIEVESLGDGRRLISLRAGEPLVVGSGPRAQLRLRDPDARPCERVLRLGPEGVEVADLRLSEAADPGSPLAVGEALIVGLSRLRLLRLIKRDEAAPEIDLIATARLSQQVTPDLFQSDRMQRLHGKPLVRRTPLEFVSCGGCGRVLRATLGDEALERGALRCRRCLERRALSGWRPFGFEPYALEIDGQDSAAGRWRLMRGADGLGRPASLWVTPLPPEAREGWVARAQAAAEVRHPHLLALRAAGAEGSLGLLLFEDPEAQSLAEAVSRDGAFAPQAFWELAEAALQALRALRSAGRLLPWLNPEELLVSPTRGLLVPPVTRAELSSALRRAGRFVGGAEDRWWLAPEPLQGEAALLYQLGASLDLALRGEPCREASARTPIPHAPELAEALLAQLMSLDEGRRIGGLDALASALVLAREGERDGAAEEQL